MNIFNTLKGSAEQIETKKPRNQLCADCGIKKINFYVYFWKQFLNAFKIDVYYYY